MPRPRVIPEFSAQVDAGGHPPLMGGKPSLRETLSQQAAESARLSDPRVHAAPPHAGRSRDPASSGLGFPNRPPQSLRLL